MLLLMQYIPWISGCLSHECKMGNQTDQSKSPYLMTSAILIGQFHFPVLRSWTSDLKSTVCNMFVTLQKFPFHMGCRLYQNLAKLSKLSETKDVQMSLRIHMHICTTEDIVHTNCPIKLLCIVHLMQGRNIGNPSHTPLPLVA